MIVSRSMHVEHGIPPKGRVSNDVFALPIKQTLRHAFDIIQGKLHELETQEVCCFSLASRPNG